MTPMFSPEAKKQIVVSVCTFVCTCGALALTLAPFTTA